MVKGNVGQKTHKLSPVSPIVSTDAPKVSNNYSDKRPDELLHHLLNVLQF